MENWFKINLILEILQQSVGRAASESKEGWVLFVLCSMFEGDDSASFFSSGAELFKPLLKSVRTKHS